MESKMTREKLGVVVAMLEGRDKNKKRLRLEEAKLRMLLNDPGFDISRELKFINQGRIADALINFIDKNLIMPALIKLFKR
ncbi:hypothetical protein [Campylobacter sp. RM16192]|uniref:hypothetical protein n=1 Tax=Campylobacter sp. RM16192 TaxID=1660080 RepID=UPI001452175C|nr:hypothetical protein [Campylobacter sp. RM16192]QCD51892.1 hypothetical protein CDOMC_0230 [Campylobacter sp. RM16192]